jgi:hypothetical protein
VKIIYHCYGGTHSSVLAAAAHLKLIPTGKEPDRKLLKGLPFFDKQLKKDLGRIFFLGRDEQGHDVFIVGRLDCPEIIEKGLYDLAKIFSLPREDFMTVNAMSCVSGSMKIGGFLSRALGIVGLGRPIVVWGSIRAYRHLKELVQNTKKKLGELS